MEPIKLIALQRYIREHNALDGSIWDVLSGKVFNRSTGDNIEQFKVYRDDISSITGGYSIVGEHQARVVCHGYRHIDFMHVPKEYCEGNEVKGFTFKPRNTYTFQQDVIEPQLFPSKLLPFLINAEWCVKDVDQKILNKLKYYEED